MMMTICLVHSCLLVFCFLSPLFFQIINSQLLLPHSPARLLIPLLAIIAGYLVTTSISHVIQTHKRVRVVHEIARTLTCIASNTNTHTHTMTIRTRTAYTQPYTLQIQNQNVQRGVHIFVLNIYENVYKSDDNKAFII